MLFDDSHAFWAVVDDLVVTPLVDGHLAPFARKSLNKESGRKSTEKKLKANLIRSGKTEKANLLSKAPNEFLAHGTKYRLPECLSIIQGHVMIMPQNFTVGTNLCPLTGKTFSTFPPLLMISSSSASTHSETSRMRLPHGFIGCVN